MPFDAKDRNIKELLSDNIFVIPINQRKYVWDDKNWKDLITDIFLVCDENSKGHFIGSIVLEEDQENNSIKYYKIIDGQQRIITITILLSALYQIYLNNDLYKESNALKKYCFAHDSNNNRFFIINNPDIGFKAMVEDVFSKNEAFDFIWIERPLKNKSNEKIFDAYNYFYDNINQKLKLIEDKKKYILKIFETIIGLSYINITTSTNEDSYTIFEILNARGQKLEDHELLKNLLLKYSHNKENTKETWQNIINNVTVGGKCYIKQFIKHYSMHKFLSKNYSSPYWIIKENIDKSDIEQFIKDLFIKSNIYREFLSPHEIEDSMIKRQIYTFFNANKQTQYRPILMSITNQFNNGKININEYNEILIFLKKFFISFTLISLEKSNKIENVIYKYSSKLENEFSESLLNEFKNSIKRKFPSKILFSKRMDTMAWSKKQDSPYNDDKLKSKIRIIFDLIEEYNTGSVPVVNYTIEHISSDDGGDENSKIGNLLPLEEELNSKAANKPLDQKLSIYKQSQLKTVMRFHERYLNNAFNIESRHKFIIDLLYDDVLKI